MANKKLTEEEKVERKAERELDEVTEEATVDEKADKEEKEAKKNEKKFGKRVHVVPQTVLHLRMTFIEEVLGGWPGDEQIYSKYVASKAPDAMTFKEEVEIFGQEDVEMQNTTIFPRDKNGRVCVKEYQLRGFLMSAAEALKRAGLLEITAHKKVITQLVKFSASKGDRIDPWIPLIIPKGKAIYLNQRPIRGNTPKGEITALASSEALPAGTMFECYAFLFNPKLEGALLSYLEYGKVNGLLQNRNAGCGRFTVEVERNGKWIPVEEA